MDITKRDTAAIVLTWVAALAGAFVLAVVGADDDPGTNEGAGAGALAAIAGGLLTGVSFLVQRRTAARKRAAALREGARPPLEGSKLARGQWAALGISVGLWILGTIVAIAIGIPDDLASIVGGSPPVAYLLIRHHRRAQG